MQEFFIKLLEIPEFLSENLSLIALNLIGFAICVVLIKLSYFQNLLYSILYLSILSLLVSLEYLIMDAPDVSMTESSIGVCVSTAIFLSAAHKLSLANVNKTKNVIPALILCSIVFFLFLYLGKDIYYYASGNTPVHNYLSKYYLENTGKDIGIYSVVAAILASYRGFDTLGETCVILTAGISVLIIFANRNRNDNVKQ